MNIMMMNIMMTHNHRLGTECLNIEYKMNIVQKKISIYLFLILSTSNSYVSVE